MSRNAWMHINEVMESLAVLSADWMGRLSTDLHAKGSNLSAVAIAQLYLIPWAKEAEREYRRHIKDGEDLVDYYEFIAEFGTRKYREFMAEDNLLSPLELPESPEPSELSEPRDSATTERGVE